MKIIGSRRELKPLIDIALSAFALSGIESFLAAVHGTILKRKVRYPVLEYAADEFYRHLPANIHLSATDGIIGLNENGSDVIAGKMLQLRLSAHFNESFRKAQEYIILGSNWLSCDTLGERVFGYALLTEPQKTIPVLTKMCRKGNKWIVRAVGVAAHYAVKKGLLKTYVDEMFGLLLAHANTTDFHTKKGIGWAAKTIAKFHPDIIRKYETDLRSAETGAWFKTKINTGLGRSYKYADRYTG